MFLQNEFDEIYANIFQILGIENNPLDRGHQDKLTAFKQELRVISTTLQQQRAILLYAERIATAARPSEVTIPVQPDPSPGSYLVPPVDTYLEQHHSSSFSRERSYSGHHQRNAPTTHNARPGVPSSQIDPTDPSGVQGLLIQDSYALIERKMSLFEELKIRAEELEEEVWHAFLLPLLLVYFPCDRLTAITY